MKLLSLWIRRLLGDLLVAHGGGVLVLVLVELVEGVPLARLPEVLPPLWAAIAAALTLLGSTLACWRMRREGVVLAMGTLGVNPRGLLLVAAMMGALGGVASGVEAGHRRPTPGTWQRVQGGWWKDGTLVPDPGQSPSQLRPPETWNFQEADVPVGAAAGALGAGLGLYAGAIAALVGTGMLVVGGALVRGLVERGILDAWGSLSPALFLLLGLAALVWRAPIFPRRH